MKLRKHIITLVLPAVAALLLLSCSDKWDDHYDGNGSVPSRNLLQAIGEESDLSLFYRLLTLTGTDSLLTTHQTYTVWAPVNDALSSVDWNDKAQLMRIAYNHIGRYSHPTSTGSDHTIYMLNGKAMRYTASMEFDGVKILEGDLLAQNGVLHKVQSMLPYKYNFMEYLSTHDEYSHIYGFIKSFSCKKYDASLSTNYDSVFVDYNRLLQDATYGIGAIGEEDSVYTMILPDNTAWDAAYARISPCFKFYSKDTAYADSVQRVQTSLAILSGLTFKGRVGREALPDSLVTVTSNVIRRPAAYLQGYTAVDASNGLLYTANGVLNYDDTCVWNHKIVVEAENMDGRSNLSGTNAYIRNTDINSAVHGVSANGYLEVSCGSVDGGILYNIPNVLSCKYDVYVDFVPPVIDGEKVAAELTKVQFLLKYRNDKGGTSNYNNNSGTLVGGTADSAVITVKAFSAISIPVSNYYDSMWYLTPGNSAADVSVTTTLQVKTKVTATDAKNGYVRKFRIDRIRLVPVLE